MLKKIMLLISCLQFTCVAAVQYTISELNIASIPEEPIFLDPTLLNNNGTVAGNADKTVSISEDQAYGFILNDTFHLLEATPSEVIGLNDLDQLAGTAHDKAFIWDKTTGMTFIDTPFPATAGSLNNLGDVAIVSNAIFDDIEMVDFEDFTNRLYLWNATEGLRKISTESIFSKNQIGWPMVVNDQKQVLFNKIKFDQKEGTVHGEGFSVVQNNKVIKQEKGFRESNKSLFPVSMNNNGDVACVVMTESRKTSTLSFDSVIYTNSGKKIDISKKNRNIEIMHLNDKMQAVGDLGTGKLSEYDEELTLGFVWDEKNGVQDLNTLVKKDDHSVVIRSAIQINNKGQILVDCEAEHYTFYAILNPISE